MTGEDQRRDREERHEPHAPYEWHEPMHDEQEHTHTHAGNRTVNHGPDDLAPEGTAPDGRTQDGENSARSDSARSDSGGTSPTGKGSDGEGSGATAPFGFAGLGLVGGTGPGGTGSHDGHGLDDPDGRLDGLDGLDGLDDLEPGEQALRALLHGAVQDMRPRDGALDHLRRAVPARRARKRQAVIGMAAAALFFGTAIPAVLHVSDVTGSGADPSIAGSSSQAQGGTGQGKNPDGGSSTSGGTGGQSKDDGGGQSGDTGKSSGTGGGPGGGASASASPGTDVPLCTAAQLGSATSTVASPDSAGNVYGTFRVVNVSGTACRLTEQGDVATLAQGAADAGKITVVRHTPGDAATGLSASPADGTFELSLGPGDTYDVQFGWVPSETCPTTGGGTGTGGGGASPDPSPSTETGAGTGGGTGTVTSSGTGGTAAQLLRADGTADGSVVVTYTPLTGSPAVSATVSGACAGTVYRTGPFLDAQTP
ncbi:hypothetical protein [Streptomyces sp. NPDC047000]|uniref:hypothetical protein n=1 Tax=Streptomyces sp. NPDC047000 TaxID=3155474 RepID=UPI0033D1F484